jgi:hypothetical protein
VLEALYYLAPGVPVVGRLQARQERKRGFHVPGVLAEDVVGELENEYVVCEGFLFVSPPVSLAAGGFAPPFIDQGGGGLHARRAI